MTQTANIGMQGYTPTAKIGKGNPEAEKYGRMWEQKKYRINAPGESLAPMFLNRARPKRGATIIDFGCGTGRGGLALFKAGLKVRMLDFVRNSLDDKVRDALNDSDFVFIKADLEQQIPVTAEYGYCTDVMEHIPDARVDQVLDNILDSAKSVFFSICTQPDGCGQIIGETLHVSVHPYSWWLSKLAIHGAVIEWSESKDPYAFFYVSSWKSGKEILHSGQLNTEEEQIRKNVAYNIAQGWNQVSPHEVTDLECMILGGGPSLNDFADEIKAKRDQGVKLLTMNGTYNWCLERGIIPSAQLVVDARAFNARFTKPIIDECRYLISSQCDPSVLEGLPKDRTWIWHTNPELVKDLVGDQYESAFFIPGGSCILLRAVPLMRMLGYKKFHLYGCDSCVQGTSHHAYSQPENDGSPIAPVIVEGRMFWCSPWHVSQAEEFMEMVRQMGNEVDLAVYGDGLLAWIIEVSAKLAMEGINGSSTMENV